MPIMVHTPNQSNSKTGVPPIFMNADGNALTAWSISGQTVQNGTPTPDNPIYPDFVVDRTENVMPASPAGTHEENGLTFTSNGSGIYTVSGTATETTLYIFWLNSTFTIPIASRQGGHGTFSLFNSQAPSTTGAPCRAQFFLGDTLQDTWALTTVNRRANNYGTMGGLKCDGFGIYIYEGIEIDMQISPVFTDNGTYPDSYIPYGYKLPLTCGSQTTPIYLGQVQTVRRVKKLVLDGTERWSADASTCQANMPLPITAGSRMVFSTHYNGTVQANNGNAWINAALKTLFIMDTAHATNITVFKQFLIDQYAAGTPVCVWYVMAEPETGIINEPLAKIGDYADTVASANTGAPSIITSEGYQNLTVGTTIQPSSVSVAYNLPEFSEVTKILDSSGNEITKVLDNNGTAVFVAHT